jgi:hypothetical protein
LVLISNTITQTGPLAVPNHIYVTFYCHSEQSKESLISEVATLR